MSANNVSGSGTKNDPWVLTTPSRASEYKVYRDESAKPPALVCVVGSTTLSYQLRCLEDLHAMLKANGDWVPLGSADEQKPAAAGTVEEVDEDRCRLHSRADSLEWLAVRLVTLGCDFEVHEPPELADHLRTLASRAARAAGPAD